MQRYKVFINEHSILFSSNLEKSTIVDNLLTLHNPNSESMKLVVEWLLVENVKTVVCFESQDLENLWSSFYYLFEIVEAAGGKVKNQHGEILFIYRLGKWDLPKGKIEVGEDRNSAAVREVEEECGISKLKITRALETTYHMYQMGERLILKPTYWFEMFCADESELIPQKEEAIEKAKWVNEADLSEQLNNTYASLKKIITN